MPNGMHTSITSVWNEWWFNGLGNSVIITGKFHKSYQIMKKKKHKNKSKRKIFDNANWYDIWQMDERRSFILIFLNRTTKRLIQMVMFIEANSKCDLLIINDNIFSCQFFCTSHLWSSDCIMFTIRNALLWPAATRL